MNPKRILQLFVLVAFISACKITKNQYNDKKPIVANQTQPVPYIAETAKLKPSKRNETDILHMKLNVKFNYNTQQLEGNATLTCKPFFKSIQKVMLNARYFNITQIGLIVNKDTLPLKFSYNQQLLSIELNRVYARNESFNLFIAYTANPEKVALKKGDAIAADKGLYFINPLKNQPYKPQQIWTQGEPEANSAWFPTVDAPYEKFSHEIAITVDSDLTTISNGELMKQKINTDGSRTDFWKQSKPHSAYLVMMAVGEFAEIKDYWRDSIAVNAYVEPMYAKQAKMIFGSTPEMMELYSKKLGVDYPWEKYSQVVVRDFVSGAMENTSAVIHFEGLQHTEREHIDNTHEDIIAHELFHHWFGDLVTAKSWNNISLNESFATYGEYIWQEYKYGKQEANLELNKNLTAYLARKSKHKACLYREQYNEIDEVFDVVSYQKGSLVLHLLRNYLGDEIFFESLKKYLTQYGYQSAEVHQLRLVFEEVSGEDLNWFFNQWFFNAGHPIIELNYEYGTTRADVKLTIKQTQTKEWPIFVLPVNVALYTKTGVKVVPITITKKEQSFDFFADSEIQFVYFDSDKILPADIQYGLTRHETMMAINTCKNYLDKYFALKTWLGFITDSITTDEQHMLHDLLSNNFWGNRLLGLTALQNLDSLIAMHFESELVELAHQDTKSLNRATALRLLEVINVNKHEAVFKKALTDSSYRVVTTALMALNKINVAYCLEACNQLSIDSNELLRNQIAAIYSTTSNVNAVIFFENCLDRFSKRFDEYMSYYSRYLQITSPQNQVAAIAGIKQRYLNTDNQTAKQNMFIWVKAMQGPWQDKLKDSKEKLATTSNPEQIEKIKREIEEAEQMINAYASIQN